MQNAGFHQRFPFFYRARRNDQIQRSQALFCASYVEGASPQRLGACGGILLYRGAAMNAPAIRSAEDLRNRYRKLVSAGERLSVTEQQYVRINLPYVRRNMREFLKQRIRK